MCGKFEACLHHLNVLYDSFAEVLSSLFTASKTNTNHLQSGQNHGGLPTKEGNSPNRHSTDMREELKNIIKTRCDNNVMEVTLPTLLTQARVQPTHHHLP